MSHKMVTRMGIVTVDPTVLWGTPVFPGTKVPAETLFDYLEQGETLDPFLRDFPSVSRATATAAIRGAGRVLIEVGRESAEAR